MTCVFPSFITTSVKEEITLLFHVFSSIKLCYLVLSFMDFNDLSSILFVSLSQTSKTWRYLTVTMKVVLN